jgi:hypothetical protein
MRFVFAICCALFEAAKGDCCRAEVRKIFGGMKMRVCIAWELLLLLAGLIEPDEENFEMDFGRNGRGVRVVAIHESAANQSAGCERFDGEQRAAAAGRCDAARGVLRLPFERNKVAVVFARRADVVADCERRERRARKHEFFRLAKW